MESESTESTAESTESTAESTESTTESTEESTESIFESDPPSLSITRKYTSSMTATTTKAETTLLDVATTVCDFFVLFFFDFAIV